MADGTKIAWDYYATETVRKVKGVVCHGRGRPPNVVKRLFYISP